jgi:hypothetical protein
MKIEQGMLVKTLKGSIVKTENQPVPGYWSCDDGGIYLEAALRETNPVERKHYSLVTNPDQDSRSS